MKSSTIRRSTLSRETMEVIENLAKEQKSDEGLGEYVRPEEIEALADEKSSKSQEIDLLWQNFKTTQFSSSPLLCGIWGFAAGILVSVIVVGVVFSFSVKSGKIQLVKHSSAGSVAEQTLEQQADIAQDEVDNKVNVNIPSDDENNQSAQAENNTETQASTSEPASFDTSKMKKYIVKSGDTGESIIKHYYGSYSPEKAELIMKANNLNSLDRINIDQELLIPVE